MQKGESPALDEWMEDGDNFRELHRWSKDQQQARIDSVTGAFKPINQVQVNGMANGSSAQPMMTLNPNMMAMGSLGQQPTHQFQGGEDQWPALSSDLTPQQQNDLAMSEIINSYVQFGQITPPDDLSSIGIHPDKMFLNASQAFPDAKKIDTPSEEPDEPFEPDPMQQNLLWAKQEADDSPRVPLIDVPSHSGRSPRSRRGKNKKTKESDPKRQEFLARNRLAASKSRQKKKEWTSQLETRCRDLQAERSHLAFFIAGLKEEIIMLKTEMLKHSSCKCHSIRAYLEKSANSMSPAGFSTNPPSQLQSPTSEQQPFANGSGSSNFSNGDVQTPSLSSAVVSTTDSPALPVEVTLDTPNSVEALQSPIIDSKFDDELGMDDGLLENSD